MIRPKPSLRMCGNVDMTCVKIEEDDRCTQCKGDHHSANRVEKLSLAEDVVGPNDSYSSSVVV